MDRKKKCDEQFDASSGQCKTCSRIGLRCKRLKGLKYTGASRGQTSPPRSPSPPNQIPERTAEKASSDVDSERTAEEVTLTESNEHAKDALLTCLSSTTLNRASYLALRYYISRLIPCRATYRNSETGFHMLVSRAVGQPGVMDALLAFSMAHQAESADPSTYLDLHEKALNQYHKAIQQFRSALMAESLDAEISSTIAVLLVATETTNGGVAGWRLHSGGATAILNSGKAKFDPSVNVYHRFLTRSLIYFDVLGAVMLGIKPGLDGHFYNQERDNLVSSNVHSMVAANALVLGILADICRLGAQIYQDRENGLSMEFDKLYENANDLESQLLAASAPTSYSVLVGFLFEAYRHASLLLLYQILNHGDRQGFLISSISERYATRLQYLMYYVQRIPGNSAPASSLLFPLFIAGVATSDDDDKSAIMSKLSELHTLRRFGNIASVMSVLQEIWNSSQIERGNLDWQEWLRKSGKFVALF